TNSLFWRASLSPPVARLPARARSPRRSSSSLVWGAGAPPPVAPGAPGVGSLRSTPSSLPTSGAADGQDGDIVAHRLGGEVAGGLEQVLAQHAGGHVGVSPQGVGDALLAEELLAVAHLGQPVGVEQQQVA